MTDECGSGDASGECIVDSACTGAGEYIDDSDDEDEFAGDMCNEGFEWATFNLSRELSRRSLLLLA